MGSASSQSNSVAQNGFGDVDDLIYQLNGTGVASVTPPSSSSAPPGLATVPSSPSSNAAVEDEASLSTVPNAEPVSAAGSSLELGMDPVAPRQPRTRGLRGRVRCAQGTRSTRATKTT